MCDNEEEGGGREAKESDAWVQLLSFYHFSVSLDRPDASVVFGNFIKSFHRITSPFALAFLIYFGVVLSL